jgi:dCTP deaminase
MSPGEFVLAQTQEMFYLPNDLAFEYKLKSSMARNGLNHLLAGHADPGWHGSVLTLEFHNISQFHPLILKTGMKAGQLVFHRGEPVPAEASYAVRGQYNNTDQATASRGLR